MVDIDESATAALDFRRAFDSLDHSMAKVMVGARVEQETLARLDRVAAVMALEQRGKSDSVDGITFSRSVHRRL